MLTSLSAAQPAQKQKKQCGVEAKSQKHTISRGQQFSQRWLPNSNEHPLLIARWYFPSKRETTEQLQQEKFKLFHMFVKMRKDADVCVVRCDPSGVVT